MKRSRICQFAGVRNNLGLSIDSMNNLALKAYKIQLDQELKSNDHRLYALVLLNKLKITSNEILCFIAKLSLVTNLLLVVWLRQ